jgi:hypothetical protein
MRAADPCPTNNAKRAKHSKILKPGCFFVFTPFYQLAYSVLCVRASVLVFRPLTICRCSRMRVRLSGSLPRVLLPHTYTQDGWFLQPERRPARLPRRTIFSRCICRCSRMRGSNVRPPPPTHTPPPTGFPMSAHLSRLRLFQRHLRSLGWVWVWVWDWVHTPPHTILSFSPPSFHTISLPPTFTSA